MYRRYLNISLVLSMYLYTRCVVMVDPKYTPNTFISKLKAHFAEWFWITTIYLHWISPFGLVWFSNATTLHIYPLWNKEQVQPMYPIYSILSLHWRHNDHDGVSTHQPHCCLLNRLFRCRSKKTSKLRVTGLCVENSPGPVNSPHKGPVTRKMFPFDDVIMVTADDLMMQ